MLSPGPINFYFERKPEPGNESEPGAEPGIERRIEPEPGVEPEPSHGYTYSHDELCDNIYRSSLPQKVDSVNIIFQHIVMLGSLLNFL